MTDNLPPFDNEAWQALHYNPNTDDLVEFIKSYARAAIEASRAAVPAVDDSKDQE